MSLRKLPVQTQTLIALAAAGATLAASAMLVACGNGDDNNVPAVHVPDAGPDGTVADGATPDGEASDAATGTDAAAGEGGPDAEAAETGPDGAGADAAVADAAPDGD
jgi:hypothetical protein